MRVENTEPRSTENKKHRGEQPVFFCAIYS